MLEYAFCVWDSYLVKYINSLEMVQRRAAWWATSNYAGLAKWDKYFIHPKQSTVGYTCIEKTDIKTEVILKGGIAHHV